MLGVDMSPLSALIQTEPSPLGLNTALITLHLNGVLSGCVDGGVLSRLYTYHSLLGKSDTRNTKIQ